MRAVVPNREEFLCWEKNFREGVSALFKFSSYEFLIFHMLFHVQNTYFDDGFMSLLFV